MQLPSLQAWNGGNPFKEEHDRLVEQADKAAETLLQGEAEAAEKLQQAQTKAARKRQKKAEKYEPFFLTYLLSTTYVEIVNF